MAQNLNTTSHVITTENKLPLWVTIIGSGFFSGYAPFASGTVGSAVGLLFFLIPNFHQLYIIIPATAILFALGTFAADTMEKKFGQDPKVVTIDEIVGMFISLWMIPLNWTNVLLAFFIFRILDILKPYPAGECDKKRGGINIMLDDVFAGIYTNIILNLALYYL